MIRDISIDTIRAIAIIYVIAILHMSDYTQLYNTEGVFVYCITSAAMGVFMFISGLLLKNKYEITNYKESIYFLKRRFFRIIPLYVFAVSYFVIVGDMPWWRILLSVIGMSAFVQPMTHTLWFVEMIILFYLLYLVLWSKKTDMVILKSSLLYLIILLLDGRVLNVDIRFFYYFPCFVLGMILPKSQFELFKKSKNLFFSALCFFLLLAFALNRNESWGITYCILMAFVSILGAHVIVFLSDFLSKKMNGGGDFVYFIY